jgi:hypothetical protein
MPCTTMQGQILFSSRYSRTNAADIMLVSLVGSTPKNFRWTSMDKTQDSTAAALKFNRERDGVSCSQTSRFDVLGVNHQSSKLKAAGRLT